MKLKRPQSKQPIPKYAKKVFSGVIFDIYQWEQELFDGSTTTFEKAKRKVDSVNVLPITKEGKIILTKQEQPQEQPFYGAIGGRMDKGETPLDTAEREMLEESGFEAEKFELLNAVQWDIKVDWVCWTFIAKGIKKIQDKETEAGEKINLVEFSFDEYMDIILEPNYRDQELTLFFLKAMQNKKQFKEIRSKFAN